jgi:hypothetical protein
MLAEQSLERRVLNRLGHTVANVLNRSEVLVTMTSQLAAQPANVDVYSARAAKAVNAPDASQKLLTGKHSTRILHQELEQLELHPGQVYPPALHGHLIGVEVQGYLTDSQL